MPEIRTISDMLSLWPSRKAVADDLQTTVGRVHKWAQTDSIPAVFHARLVRAAARRAIPITAEDLVRLHDRPEAAA